MSTIQNAPQSATARQFLSRLAIYASCGVVSGIIAVVASILVEFLVNGFHAFAVGGLTRHLEFWSPLRRPFWDVARTRFEERYLAGLIAGCVFGALTAGLSKPSRCVASLTALGASIVGSVGTVLIVFWHGLLFGHVIMNPADLVSASVECAATGAVFGFVQGMLTLIVEKTAAKWEQQESRLATECAKLDPAFEKGLAEGIPDGVD